MINLTDKQKIILGAVLEKKPQRQIAREMTREEAGHFYEIVLERHGKKSNIITSARSPEEWQKLFPDPILGNSALDRLAHSSYQICMEGPSIREQNRPK